jgi:hypothetical protein
VPKKKNELAGRKEGGLGELVDSPKGRVHLRQRSAQSYVDKLPKVGSLQGKESASIGRVGRLYIAKGETK